MADRAHWLTVGWLHWYAPEFNDIGGCHDLKAHHMAHQTFADTDALGRAIHHAVDELNTARRRNVGSDPAWHRELPPIKLDVTRARLFVGRCACCGTRPIGHCAERAGTRLAVSQSSWGDGGTH